MLEKPVRRKYSAEYKQRALEEADRCSQAGEVTELLRRERTGAAIASRIRSVTAVARHAPELFDLFEQHVSQLRDDRLGTCLARRFHGTTPELLQAVVRRAIDPFGVSLDELHHDSTSVSFSGLLSHGSCCEAR